MTEKLYDIQLAASVLKMSESTLKWWLEGGQRRGRSYPPVLREEPNGSAIVTWGEFVEARYLLAYRRDLRVALSQLRAWIAMARDHLGVSYPLAHQRPWVGEGRKILIDAQMSARLPADLWAMFQVEGGQILLLPPAESFMEKIEFENDEVVRVRPAGAESSIVIDPQVRFGMATVRGVPTEAIIDQIEGGDTVEMVASDFDLGLTEVAEVIAYEKPRLVAAA